MIIHSAFITSANSSSLLQGNDILTNEMLADSPGSDATGNRIEITRSESHGTQPRLSPRRSDREVSANIQEKRKKRKNSKKHRKRERRRKKRQRRKRIRAAFRAGKRGLLLE